MDIYYPNMESYKLHVQSITDGRLDNRNEPNIGLPEFHSFVPDHAYVEANMEITRIFPDRFFYDNKIVGKFEDIADLPCIVHLTTKPNTISLYHTKPASQSRRTEFFNAYMNMSAIITSQIYREIEKLLKQVNISMYPIHPSLDKAVRYYDSRKYFKTITCIVEKSLIAVQILKSLIRDNVSFDMSTCHVIPRFNWLIIENDNAEELIIVD